MIFHYHVRYLVGSQLSGSPVQIYSQLWQQIYMVHKYMAYDQLHSWLNTTTNYSSSIPMFII